MSKPEAPVALFRAASIVTLALALGACGSRQPVVIINDLSVEPRDLLKIDLNPGDLNPGDLKVSPCGVAPCAGDTPICNENKRKCVACITDGDCPNDSVCKMDACMQGCSAIHKDNCAADAGTCDVDMGFCHGCLKDADCTTPGKTACDLTSGRCVLCTLQSDKCGKDSYCVVNAGVPSCVAGCKGDDECRQQGGQGFACCNHVCIDITKTATDCGACGRSCGNGACCTSKCIDTQADILNCGGCGKVCPANNNVPTCNAGVCMPGACNPGFAHCTNNPADVCETSVLSDTRNCGKCGNLCTVKNGSGLCINGTCSIGSCNPGFRDCDGDINNGCEVDVSSDLKNCGLCGQVCSLTANAAQVGCLGGNCAITKCSAGFLNCNVIAADGCEINGNGDVKNCGACGNVCLSPQNAGVTCTGGGCVYGPCMNGFSNCNGNLATGCTINLTNDLSNCGACSNVCTPLANAAVACTNSKCVLASCNAGFADCNNTGADGCEINTNTDAKNCGACGKACFAGWSCSNAKCTPPYTLVGTVGALSYYKVAVTGAMTDTNIYNTCVAGGLGVGCEAGGNMACMYNDKLCIPSSEGACGLPLSQLTAALGCKSPQTCPDLVGVYQYMGHTFGKSDGACGVEALQFCTDGSGQVNKFALCATQ